MIIEMKRTIEEIRVKAKLLNAAAAWVLQDCASAMRGYSLGSLIDEIKYIESAADDALSILEAMPSEEGECDVK